MDHKAPSQQQLSVGSGFLKDLTKKRIPVYIHCKNGHGRSPTLVAAYLISIGKTVEDAIRLIKKKRPSIHMNNIHVAALNKFEKLLK